MRLKAVACFFLFAASGNSGAQIASPSVASPPSIRVAFWNIQWFPGRRPNASAAAERGICVELMST